jgi:hypothetical protein
MRYKTNKEQCQSRYAKTNSMKGKKEKPAGENDARLIRNFTCASNRVEAYYRDLQGRVKFPTGGKSPRVVLIRLK